MGGGAHPHRAHPMQCTFTRYAQRPAPEPSLLSRIAHQTLASLAIAGLIILAHLDLIIWGV